MHKLENAKLLAEYKPAEKTIQVVDKADSYNLPEAVNQTVRGLDKAWQMLEACFSGETTFRQAVSILEAAGVRMWDFCLMD